MRAANSSSITEGVLDLLPNLFQEYTHIITDSNEQIRAVAEQMRKEGNIRTFTPQNVLDGHTLGAVDGGRASEELSGGDLIVVGATIADGLKTTPLYSLEPFSESYATILPHVSANDNVAGRIMSALELRVLEQAKSDYLIIDGAYLNNASEILYGLLTGGKILTERLLDLNEDGILEAAVTRVLNPGGTENPARIVAIPKSDSSFIYGKKYLQDVDSSENIPDRIFATRALQPGEFFTPRPLETNPALFTSWEKHFDRVHNARAREFLEGKKELLLNLGGVGDQTADSHMFATYFKPSTWDGLDRAIKVEFYSSQAEEATSVAETVVTRIDDDIDGNTIMEPISQFNVDVLAKDVSQGIDVARASLVAEARDGVEAQGILRGYRT